MKAERLLIILVVILFCMVLVPASRASFVDIHVDHIDFFTQEGQARLLNGDNTVNLGDGSRTIEWYHVFEACPSCTTGDIRFTLEIIADDVDGASEIGGLGITLGPEVDQVSVGPGGLYVGNLTDLGYFTSDPYYPGPSHPDVETDTDTYVYQPLTTSTFEFSIPASVFGGFGVADGDDEGVWNLKVKIEVPEGWELQIEESNLIADYSSVPIPSAAILLGSGLICLVGISRKFSSRSNKTR